MLNELNNGNLVCLNQIWQYNCPYLVIYEQIIDDGNPVIDIQVDEPNNNKGPLGMAGIAKDKVIMVDILSESPTLLNNRGNYFII